MVLILFGRGVFGGNGSKVTVDGAKSGFVTIGGKTTAFKDGGFSISDRPDGEYAVHIVTESGKKIECDPIRFIGGTVHPSTPASVYEAFKQLKAMQGSIDTLQQKFDEIREKYGEISLF